MCHITSVDLILLRYQLVKDIDTKNRWPQEKMNILKNHTEVVEWLICDI